MITSSNIVSAEDNTQHAEIDFKGNVDEVVEALNKTFGAQPLTRTQRIINKLGVMAGYIDESIAYHAKGAYVSVNKTGPNQIKIQCTEKRPDSNPNEQIYGQPATPILTQVMNACTPGNAAFKDYKFASLYTPK